MIEVGNKECKDVYKALSLEWLDVNGIGGYASSTILNCHTRRYHGLLVSRLERPSGKFVLLSKFEDSLIDSDKEYFLSLSKYQGSQILEDNIFLSQFRQGVNPSFIYKIGKVEILKEFVMLDGKDAILLKYKALKNPKKMKLRIRPFLAFRNHHSVLRKRDDVGFVCVGSNSGFCIEPRQDMPKLFFKFNKTPSINFASTWYFNFEYAKEMECGYEAVEDLVTPASIEFCFEEGSEIIVSASMEEITEDLETLWNNEIKERESRCKSYKGKAQRRDLCRAAEQFFNKTQQGDLSVTAGFPWFGDWGRDTMISLPGLCLNTGRLDYFIEVLKTFAKNQRNGLIPNFIGATFEENAYNSVDAALWFAVAIKKYIDVTKGYDTVRKEFWETLKSIYKSYKEGTECNIKMLDDGLLFAGGLGHQITWMDAAINGVPVTPRPGCQVEINALWYNLVCLVGELAKKFCEEEILSETKQLKNRLKESFNKTFWIEEGAYLGDFYFDGVLDKSIRPNQIFAVSLPYSLLEISKAKAVVQKVGDELLTPYGLRTLSPRDPKYTGVYRGNLEQRDRAYHNGTVWPWLIGAYADAVLAINLNNSCSLEHLQDTILHLYEHLVQAGVGGISEVFDGDSPHLPGGCISQAWSVAEVLRVADLIERKS